jgi:hypothetical protein
MGDYNTPLSSIGHSEKKINKETSELNNTTDQMDLTDLHRIFHSATEQCTFFSGAHGIFSKIHHILGHKDILNDYIFINIINQLDLMDNYRTVYPTTSNYTFKYTLNNHCD